MSYRILVINPGSTSTKLAIYENEQEVDKENLTHSPEELAPYERIIDQLPLRIRVIQEFLASRSLTTDDFQAIAGRGGFLKPIAGGTYRVNAVMAAELSTGQYGEHASNLGGIIAKNLADEAGIPAFIVDPVVVDELAAVARITGLPEMPKRSVFHALNQKAVAKRFAAAHGQKYESLNLLVAHLGGGISVGCHHHGRVVEVNNALDGTGPFSPERTGTVQAGQFYRLILDKNWSLAQVKKALAGQGGIVAHLGTSDVREVERRLAANDAQAQLIHDALAYQVAREIAAAAVAVKGQVDHILLTGGIAHSALLTGKISDSVQFIAPVTVLPGEDELQALAEGAYRILSGQEQPQEYV